MLAMEPDKAGGYGYGSTKELSFLRVISGPDFVPNLEHFNRM